METIRDETKTEVVATAPKPGAGVRGGGGTTSIFGPMGGGRQDSTKGKEVIPFQFGGKKRKNSGENGQRGGARRGNAQKKRRTRRGM